MAINPVERKEETRVERPERRVVQERREEPKQIEAKEERRETDDRKKIAEA